MDTEPVNVVFKRENKKEGMVHMKKILNIIDLIIYYMTGTLFLFLFIVNVVQIILRSTTGKSMLWVVDFSQLAMIWIVFLGASVAVYRHDHLLIDFIKHKVSKANAYLLDLTTRSLFLVFMLVVVYNGIHITKIRMNIDFISLGWPTGYAYAALPITGIIISIYLFYFICSSIKGMRNKNDRHMKYEGGT